MAWKLTSGLLAALLLWTCASLVKVENRLYALEVGMCPSTTVGLPPDFACLEKVETRTSWVAHLLYGLGR